MKKIIFYVSLVFLFSNSCTVYKPISQNNIKNTPKQPITTTSQQDLIKLKTQKRIIDEAYFWGYYFLLKNIF